jgi:glycosyltransferase 2 family protein
MAIESGETGKRRLGIPPVVQHVLKFALGGAAIWALIHFGALDPAVVGQAFVRNPLLCLAAFLSYLILVVGAAWIRWYLLLRQAGLKMAVGRVFSLQMMGVFFNSLIPGGTGGDLVKGYYLFKENADKDKSLALTSIAMDRFVGLYGLLCVAMAMTALNYELWMGSPEMRINSIFYACVFLIFSGSIAYFFSPWSSRFLEHPRLHKAPGGRFLRSLFDSLLVYRARPLGLLAPLALGIVVDCGLILLYYFSANSLGLTLPLRVHGFVVPTITMVNGIPLSPAGLGVGEAFGEWMYRNLGVAEGGSEVLALVHIFIIATSLFGAPFYFLYRVKPEGGKNA